MDFQKLNKSFINNISFKNDENFYENLQKNLYKYLFEDNDFQKDNFLYGLFIACKNHIFHNKISIIDVFCYLTKLYAKKGSTDEIKDFYHYLKDFINKARFELSTNVIEIEKDENLLEILSALYTLECKNINMILSTGEINETINSNLNNDKLITIYAKNYDNIVSNLSSIKYEVLFSMKDKINIYLNNNINHENNIRISAIKDIFNKNNTLYKYIFDLNQWKNLSDEDKLEKFIGEILKINELNQIDFLKMINDKLVQSKINNEEIQKILEPINELINIENQFKKPLTDLTNIIDTEIKNRDEKYVKSILLLSEDMSEQEKKNIIEDFLKNGYENTSYTEIKSRKFNQYSIESVIKKSVNKLVGNATIMNQISAGEHLFKRISKNISDELRADYTFLVAPQIKAVERFIKESMIHNIPNETINKYSIPNKNFDLDNTNSNISLTELDFIKATLGDLDFILRKCLREKKTIFEQKYLLSSNNFSIFLATRPENHSEFYDFFVKIVRNGHFHIDNIPTIKEAIDIRTEVGFWLLCVLEELKGI